MITLASQKILFTGGTKNNITCERSSIISLKYYFDPDLPSAIRELQCNCVEIVISNAVIRTVNLEMELLERSLESFLRKTINQN